MKKLIQSIREKAKNAGIRAAAAVARIRAHKMTTVMLGMRV